MKIGIVDPDRVENYVKLLKYLEQCNLVSEVFQYKDGIGVDKCDIVLTSDEWNSRSSVLIAGAKRMGLPTLHIADGIVKWGNVWENPRSADEDSGMPMFQPILSDKIACIGPFQARLFSSWGQHSKVELTGLPRFDAYINDKIARSSYDVLEPEMSEKKRLLIIVANKPGYNSVQNEKAQQALYELNEHLAPSVASGALGVIWRVGPRSPNILPVNPAGTIDDGRHNLRLALTYCDVVISSPSTAVLEAMARDIPTCIIDYLGAPAFLHSAWTIRSKTDMDDEITSLLMGDERRMLYQRYLLHDQLRIDSPACPRVAKLMQDMISISRLARVAGGKPCYPPHLVGSPQQKHDIPYTYAPERLFPSHPVFKRRDTDQVNCEIAHLRLYCRALERQLEQVKNKQGFFNAAKRVARKLLIMLRR